MRKSQYNLLVLIEGAIIAAVCVALSFVPVQLGAGAAFDISLGLIPLFAYAVRRGLVPALCCGFLWGLIVALTKGLFLDPMQWVFDYLLAFGFAGFFGLYSKSIQKNLEASAKKKNLILLVIAASFTGVFARWIWHYLAGATVWAQYAPEDMNPWLYSLVFNGSSFLANSVLLSVVMLALMATAPRLFRAPRL